MTDVVSEQIARCVVLTTLQSLYNRRNTHSEQTLHRTLQCWALWFRCWFSAVSKAFLACHCCCLCRSHDRQYSFANWLTHRPADPYLWQSPLSCSVCCSRRCMIWQVFTTSQRRQPAQTKYEGKLWSSDLPAICNEFHPHTVSTHVIHYTESFHVHMQTVRGQCTSGSHSDGVWPCSHVPSQEVGLVTRETGRCYQRSKICRTSQSWNFCIWTQHSRFLMDANV